MKKFLFSILLLCSNLIAAEQLLNSMFKDVEYKRLDTFFLNNTNQVNNQVNYINHKVIPFLHKKNTLLDIGAGPGNTTKQIAKSFKEITTVDPIPDYAASFNELGFRTYINNFEELKIGEQFNFILCSHVLYHIEQDKWNTFLNKFYQTIEDEGKGMLVLLAPKGKWYDFEVSLNPNKSIPNSDLILKNLNNMDIPYEITSMPCSFKTKDYNSFRNLVQLFTIGNCFPTDEFNHFSSEKKQLIAKAIDTFIERECKRGDGSYELCWEDSYVILNKHNNS